MEFRRKGPPVKESLLYRPRIEALLKEGIENSLVTLIAGVGYGKTQAVASYVKDWQQTIWLNLSSFDNIPSRFWQSFVWAVREHFPQLAEKLQALKFPNTPVKFDSFLRLFVKEVYDGERLVLIVDDYCCVHDAEVLGFFEHLAETHLENFCLLVVSSAKMDLSAAALRGGGSVFQITADDLKFTFEETREFFALHGLKLSDKIYREIDGGVDGWALAIYLLALHFRSVPQLCENDLGACMFMALGLFEKEYFLGYAPDVQVLLVKLSLLQEFSIEIVREIGGCDFAKAARSIEDNMFIYYNPITRLFSFQKMYGEFLAQKQLIIDEVEVQRIYAVAGDCFFENQRIVEAIDCYGKCGAHERMLAAILSFFRSSIVEAGLTVFFMKHLDLLQPEFLARNPVALVLKACIHIYELEIDEALEIMASLESSLEETEKNEETRSLLGEVYILLAGICMLKNDDGFAAYYKKASHCLPYGSALTPQNPMFLLNDRVFFLKGHRQGELEKMERAFHEGVPYMERVLHGGGRGLDFLYSAEAAYGLYDFAAAEEKALRSVRRALEAEQHDIVCNAYAVIAKIAFMNGNYEKMWHSSRLIQEYVNGNNISSLFNLRDSFASWFYVEMNDLERVFPWILRTGPGEKGRFPLHVGRDRLVYARYLLKKKEFHELMALLDSLETLYRKRGLWSYRLDMLIMRAAGCLRLGDEEQALNALWLAYDMSHRNGIIIPFIEMAEFMLPLIEAVRLNKDSRFRKNWLKEIYWKSSSHVKQLVGMRNRYARENRPVRPHEDNSLSKREREVLYRLTRGLTQEEIAGLHDVSVNTIKTQVRNIYNKLGAINRADAIHIATKLGIVE